MSTEFITYEEVSALFNILPGTLHSLVSRKQIPHYRPGYLDGKESRIVRFKEHEVRAWLGKVEVKS